MFDDPRKSLHRIEDELLDEELEDILYGDEEEDEQEYRQPRIRRGRRQDFHRAVYEDEDDDDFYDKRCKCCNRGISDCCGRESMFNDEEVKDKIEKEKEEDICDECSQVLNNSEYFLYGY